MSDAVKVGDRFEWRNVHDQIKPGVYTAGPPPKDLWVGDDPWFTIVDSDGKTIGQTMMFGDETAWHRLPRDQPTVPREAKSWADLRAGMRVGFRHRNARKERYDFTVLEVESARARLRGETEFYMCPTDWQTYVVTIIADPDQPAPKAPAPAEKATLRHDFTDPYADQVIPTWTDGVLIKTRVRRCSACGEVDKTPTAVCRGATNWRRSSDADARDRMRALDDMHTRKRDEKPAVETVPYRHSHVGGWSRRP